MYALPYASIAVNVTEFFCLFTLCMLSAGLLKEEPPFSDSDILTISLVIFFLIFLMILLAGKILPSIEDNINKSRQSIRKLLPKTKKNINN